MANEPPGFAAGRSDDGFVHVFPVTWSHDDSGPGGTCRITTFGKTPDGRAVCVHVRFTPFFYVQLPKDWSDARAKLFFAECAKQYDILDSKCRVVTRKSIWGFANSKECKFAQLVFPSAAAFKRARWGLAKQHATFEGNVDPVVRLFHLRGLGPCRWFRVPATADEPQRPVADVDIELEVAFTDISPSTIDARPPLVFCSYDLEAFSESGRFPVADKPGDHLINIAAAFQRYGEPEPYHRAVVCFRETAPVDGVQIVWTPHEHEVIEIWGRMMREHQVDVVLSYNGHQVRAFCPGFTVTRTSNRNHRFAMSHRWHTSRLQPGCARRLPLLF